jgi:glycyl-tRNA synthetase beta chain
MSNFDSKNEMKSNVADFLLEIGTEELPAKNLHDLVANLAFSIETGLQSAELSYSKTLVYVTPRRLAVLILHLVEKQKDRVLEKRGPSLAAAFEEDGSPTAACLGFANACGVGIDELQRTKTSAGAWLVYHKSEAGASVYQLLPQIIAHALHSLNLTKPMHWSKKDILFVRPVRWLTMLYGRELVAAELFGIKSDRITYGHRFHHPEAINIPEASVYPGLLVETGHVVADFEQRKEMIREQLAKVATKNGSVVIDEDLLNEVTGLVEWPVALLCNFSHKFLEMPIEALIAVMKKHQRCFYLVNAEGKLAPHFVIISNIVSRDPARVIEGNERVMLARFNDIKFFYHADLKKTLADYVPRLQDVVYQTGLGSLYDKTKRLENLSVFIAKKIDAAVDLAKRAAFLAKADLMTEMVKELPELQGAVGCDYALKQGEPEVVAQAIKEHYLPRFSGDALPTSTVAAAVALADRIDSLIGIFGINQLPSGDKDPFALRRAALSVIRIISEKQLDIDLKELLKFAKDNYQINFISKNLESQVLDFIYERLRGWYAEQDVPATVFNAVLARLPTSLLDFKRRLEAILNFQTLPQAATLIAAHKRVNNILKKAGSLKDKQFDITLLVEPCEKELAASLADMEKVALPLYKEGFYNEALSVLAELKGPIDDFFNAVMVMVEDEKLRNNRLALLVTLRNLLGFVADLSML